MLHEKIPSQSSPRRGSDDYWDRGDAIVCAGETVKGAHLPSFRYFENGFARDRANCYCMGRKLRGATSDSLKVLNYCYVTDGQGVWTLGGQIKDVDAESLVVCDDGYKQLSGGGKVPFGYAKDKNFVYYFNFQGKPKKLAKANPDTFMSLNDGHFGKDDKSVFFGSFRLVGAKLDSWVKIDGNYSKDQKKVFSGNRVVNSAIIDTFEVDPLFNFLAKDHVHFYRNDNEISEADYVRIKSRT